MTNKKKKNKEVRTSNLSEQEIYPESGEINLTETEMDNNKGKGTSIPFNDRVTFCFQSSRIGLQERSSSNTSAKKGASNNNNIPFGHSISKISNDIIFSNENEEKSCFLCMNNSDIKMKKLSIGDFVLVNLSLINDIPLSEKEIVPVIGARVWIDNTLDKGYFRLSTPCIDIHIPNVIMKSNNIQNQEEEEEENRGVLVYEYQIEKISKLFLPSWSKIVLSLVDIRNIYNTNVNTNIHHDHSISSDRSKKNCNYLTKPKSLPATHAVLARGKLRQLLQDVSITECLVLSVTILGVQYYYRISSLVQNKTESLQKSTQSSLKLSILKDDDGRSLDDEKEKEDIDSNFASVGVCTSDTVIVVNNRYMPNKENSVDDYQTKEESEHPSSSSLSIKSSKNDSEIVEKDVEEKRIQSKGPPINLDVSNGKQRSPPLIVGGLQKEINDIKKTLLLSLGYRSLFTNRGLSPSRGILLHGPSGCGKSTVLNYFKEAFDLHFNYEATQSFRPRSNEHSKTSDVEEGKHSPLDAPLSQAGNKSFKEEKERQEETRISNVLNKQIRKKIKNINVISITAFDIVTHSKYEEGLENYLTLCFRRARKQQPSVILIDDIDILAPKRNSKNTNDFTSFSSSRVTSTLLAMMDGCHELEEVFFIATTSRPNKVDDALRRPGRYDQEIEIDVPNEFQRAEILFTLLQPYINISNNNYMDHSSLKVQTCKEEEDNLTKSLQSLHVSSSDVDYDILPVKENNFDKIASPSGKATKDIAVKVNTKEDTGNESTSRKIWELCRRVAKTCHGMVGADLTKVIREAILLYTMEGGNADISKNILVSGAGIPITESVLLQAVRRVTPSAIKEVAIEVPNVHWSDVGGQNEVKQAITECISWPMTQPEAFKRLSISPPKGLLLYGPPGCSKTLMARAIATEGQMNFLAVKGPELLTKWLGESEQALRTLFRRARAAAPSIIFLDEIDAIAAKRSVHSDSSKASERLLSQLLTELDGLLPLKQVVIIGATNRPDLIDPALMRPGRLDRKVYVPPPNFDSRKEIFEIALKGVPIVCDTENTLQSDLSVANKNPSLIDSTENEVDYEELAKLSDGFSGAEVVAVVREACLQAIEDFITAKGVNEGGTTSEEVVRGVSQTHLVKAINKWSPQITEEMIQFYHSFQYQN